MHSERINRVLAHVHPTTVSSSHGDDDAATKNRFDWPAHQRALPRLPIPSLGDTLARYLRAVRPLVTDAEFAATERAVASFGAADGAGPRLDAALRRREAALARAFAAGALYSHGGHALPDATTWVRPFWDAMYLTGRYPVAVNSNPGLVLRPDPGPGGASQAARAASLLHASARWVAGLRAGMLAPDAAGRARTPLCMDEFPKLLGTARVPDARGRDELRTAPAHRARHCVVLRGTRMFALDLLQPREGDAGGT